MCLILFAVQPDPDQHLIVAANRDEQHQRPSARAAFWDRHILGGRDLQAGGTWLGVNRNGRFAAVTNFAETPPEPIPPRSRGDLCSNFLRGSLDGKTYLESVHKEADQYRGFNLIISDGNGVFYYGNRDREIRQLTPGFYGLSNQLLDCHWPKVNSGRELLKQSAATNFDRQSLFEILSCKGSETPFSARFILGETYGTRASTIVKIDSSNIDFEERRFDNQARETDRSQYLLHRH